MSKLQEPQTRAELESKIKALQLEIKSSEKKVVRSRESLEHRKQALARHQAKLALMG